MREFFVRVLDETLDFRMFVSTRSFASCAFALAVCAVFFDLGRTDTRRVGESFKGSDAGFNGFFNKTFLQY